MQAHFLSTDILTDYINKFYGYGHWNAKNWFIGIEEGGGNSADNITRRLNSWKALGETNLLDCYCHHRNIGFFTDQNKNKLHTQTWNKLIITILNSLGKEFTKSDILKVQLNDWGSLESDNLLIELLPLPSPGIGSWYYNDWVDLGSNLWFLKDRKSYEAEVISKRIEFIKNKISQQTPEVVIFYGNSRKQAWDKIINHPIENFEYIGKYKVGFVKLKNTLFVQCPQPNYVRPYSFWIGLGKRIRELKMNNQTH